MELGACLGLSGAYQAAALELNGHGRLIKIEAARERAAVATETIETVDLGGRATVVHARFADALDDIQTRAGAAVDYAFIDGHHDGDATIAYFEQLLPSCSPSAVFAFDDILWSEDMAAAWRRLVEDPRTGMCVDLGNIGVAALGPKPDRPLVKIRPDLRGYSLP